MRQVPRPLANVKRGRCRVRMPDNLRKSPMTGLEWAMLILAAMIGAFLFASMSALGLALLLAQVSDRLARSEENRCY